MTAPLPTPQVVRLPADWAAGQLMHQTDLNRVSTDVDQLCQITQGKPAASGLGAKPVCKVVLSASVDIPSGLPGEIYIVGWGNAVYDTDGMFDPTLADHLTVQTDGWYRITAGASWASGAGGSERVVDILVNGIADPPNASGSNQKFLAATQVFRQQVHTYVPLAAGASVYLGVWQDTGSPLSLRQSGNYGTWLAAVWDSPL